MRPEGFGAEHRLESRISRARAEPQAVDRLEPAARCRSSWSPPATKVLLTVIHRRLPDRAQLLNVSAGWHAHLDVLVTKISGKSQTIVRRFCEDWMRSQTRSK